MIEFWDLTCAYHEHLAAPLEAIRDDEMLMLVQAEGTPAVGALSHICSVSRQHSRRCAGRVEGMGVSSCCFLAAGLTCLQMVSFELS